MISDKYIQAAGFVDNSLANGPKMRSVLWMSGYMFECPNCQNHEMRAFDYGDKVSVNEIFQRIEKNSLLIKGVTFSGGEPFLQSEALCDLADMINAKGLNLWSYTGFIFEEILNSKDQHKINLLKKLDVIVDGRFDENLKDENYLYAGSTNQRIIDIQKSLIYGRVVTIKL